MIRIVVLELRFYVFFNNFGGCHSRYLEEWSGRARTGSSQQPGERGNTGTFLQSPRLEQRRKTPRMISHSGFGAPDVTRGALVCHVVLNLAERTWRKAELGEALGREVFAIKHPISAKA